MICLSTTVRNDTLQDAKEHRVSLKCRKQLRVEELEMVNMHETLDLPDLLARSLTESFLVCLPWKKKEARL